jgi:DNA-binding NarL/FixJ family response regulator
MKAHGSFELASWQEDTYDDLGGGAKLTRASVTQTFEILRLVAAGFTNGEIADRLVLSPLTAKSAMITSWVVAGR